MPTVSRTKGKSRSKPKAKPAAAPKAQRTAQRDYSIAAVGRALDLLEALARIGPAPLATLAESARCTRTAGFRLLRTLEARGFAIQDEARGIWRLGARWAVLGRAAQQQGALAAAAMPFLAALGRRWHVFAPLLPGYGDSEGGDTLPDMLAITLHSFDVIEALGVNIHLPPSKIADCLKDVGIAFLFAPAMHSAMKYVQPARRELRLRTVFNLLGPLTNPAHASAQVVGVYSDDLVEKLAEALSMLGLRRALVVHGYDGLDEISISGPTRVAEVRDAQVRTYEVTPEEFGLARAPIETISGGDAGENAKIIREVLAGKKFPCRDIVLLNAAATLVAAGRANHLSEAMPLAAKSIDSGAAAAKLQRLVEFTQQHSKTTS